MTDYSNRNRNFISSETLYLVKNYKTMDDIALANHFNMSVPNVVRKRVSLGLVRSRKKNYYIPKQYEGEELKKVLKEMQDLINKCENTSSEFLKDRAKKRLIELSGLKRGTWKKETE